MIPIGPPPWLFILICLGFLAAALLWIIWILRLAFSHRARRHLRSWRGLAFVLLSAIGCHTLWSVYTFQRALAAYEAEDKLNRRPVLAESRRLAGIDMPAGTALVLQLARTPEAFNRAEFPHPVPIGGVETLRVERYLSIHTDENYRTTGFTPENLRLTGLGESRQAGWLCDATVPIIFATHPDGSIKSFESCTAGAGNLVEGQPLPKGAEIIATEGTVYLDGSRGSDRWLIYLPPDAGLLVHGAQQKGGALLLDAGRKVVRQVPG